MNKVELVGRLTKDPEVKLTSNQTQFCNFTIAVDRRFKDANGQRQADFISCVAWRQTAAFVCRYFGKGNMLAVEGQIQTRTYQAKDGTNRHVTEVVVDNASFTGERRDNSAGQYGNTQSYQAPASAPAAPAVPEASANYAVDNLIDDDLPFGDMP
jgi:single-strand DNA-binding protein